jgi:hypothetical protein
MTLQHMTVGCHYRRFACLSPTTTHPGHLHLEGELSTAHAIASPSQHRRKYPLSHLGHLAQSCGAAVAAIDDRLRPAILVCPELLDPPPQAVPRPQTVGLKITRSAATSHIHRITMSSHRLGPPSMPRAPVTSSTRYSAATDRRLPPPCRFPSTPCTTKYLPDDSHHPVSPPCPRAPQRLSGAHRPPHRHPPPHLRPATLRSPPPSRLTMEHISW